MYEFGCGIGSRGGLAVVARWEQAQAELAHLSFTALTGPEVLALQTRLDSGYRRQPAVVTS